MIHIASQEQAHESSRSNKDEAEVAVGLFTYLCAYVGANVNVLGGEQ